jgi:hypothetical protein
MPERNNFQKIPFSKCNKNIKKEGWDVMSIRTRIYIKVSTDNQRNNDFSIDSQLRILKEHCERYYWCIL